MPQEMSRAEQASFKEGNVTSRAVIIGVDETGIYQMEIADTSTEPHVGYIIENIMKSTSFK
jgi:hypothetical protein